MGLIIALLIAGVFFLGAFYFLEFNMELDGKKEIIIKDGLVRELITKAVADPDPNSFIIDTDLKTITMGRIVIQKHWSDMFWFPYKVEKLPKDFHDGTIGYVRRFSKDYQHIKALLKKDKVNIEKTQREKLNLNK
jgi:hypothetical protein